MSGSPVGMSRVGLPEGVDARRRMPAPVAVWAGIGVMFLAVEVWVLTRWIINGGLHLVPGHGAISPAHKAVLWVWQIFLVVAFCATAWHAARTSRRDGHLSVFAAFFIGYFTSFWLTPIFNYQDQVFLPSPHGLNVSSWARYIPGWHGPNLDQQVESVITATGFAVALSLYWVYVALFVLRRFVRSRPRWGVVRTLAATVLAAIITNTILDSHFMLFELDYWPMPTNLALFAGTPNQMPWYETLGPSIFVGLPGAFMIYRAQESNTEVHFLRGSERLSLRLLAGIGFAQLCMFLYVSWNAISAGWQL
ncbi:uncharacterized protein DUF5135 [Amycolatopsis sulphurea]|uniref:Uncharacterized protein DUF5135 n=1 Tax=Amycolatopsis sulphurea TaxID=76022 RepID=A0A2A9FBV4_9PSEU|nr:spirocyclase AveC family protein [Amycolatopsis sulphurea]PFG47905.1 uncharacterized protein DUF5135 [Amycolatopsis sulphurea]